VSVVWSIPLHALSDQCARGDLDCFPAASPVWGRPTPSRNQQQLAPARACMRFESGKLIRAQLVAAKTPRPGDQLAIIHARAPGNLKLARCRHSTAFHRTRLYLLMLPRHPSSTCPTRNAFTPSQLLSSNDAWRVCLLRLFSRITCTTRVKRRLGTRLILSGFEAV